MAPRIMSGCLPDKRLRVAVGLGDEAMDGGLEVDDRFEDAAFQPTARQLGEETSTALTQASTGRRDGHSCAHGAESHNSPPGGIPEGIFHHVHTSSYICLRKGGYR
jgi:hypothetical protein